MSARTVVLCALALSALAAHSRAQNPADVVKQGEQVFAKTCATGYCHGIRGGASGAPRLAGRGFNQAYVNNVVTRGILDTAMASFAGRLSPQDIAAVVAYVATLNGIANPAVPTNAARGPALTGDAARGSQLFRVAVRGFGRCSTCHQVGGFGIPVAAPIAQVPMSVAALKSLATPNVKTGVVAGESMPVLVLSDGKKGTLFYDLTSAPPVERSTEPGSAKFSDGSDWRHASVIGAYNDEELGVVLAYLRAVAKP